jgi:uncharacterized caspase-like protein
MNWRPLTSGLLMGGLAWLAPPARAQGQTWAVVVGIDDYAKESIPDLRYAGADAKVLAQALQKLLKISPDHLFLFTGDAADSNQIPNRLNLIYRLDWLSKSASPDDVVIFYFAGHGAQVGAESFLLMKDSDNRSLETLKASALSKGDLNRLISRTAAARTLTVLDACRNDPSGAAIDPAALGSFVDSGTSREVVGLLSCSPGQRSWEWEEKKHGFFTYYLVEALQGTLKGKITPSSLAEYLTEKVSGSAQQVVHQPQTPRMFYDGPSTTNWVLGVSGGSASIKDLDVAAARSDLASAQLANLEARLRSEELRRKQAEAKLEALEKKTAGGNSEELKKLVLARDLALNELLDTRRQLEEMRTQLTGRSGPSAEAQLMQAEHEQLVAENKVLKAKIVVLEEKLGGSGGAGGNKPAARSFTLEENGPLANQVKACAQKYQQQPGPELKTELLKAQIEKEMYDSKQYGDELNRLGERYEQQVYGATGDSASLQELKQEIKEISETAQTLQGLGQRQERRTQMGVSLAEMLLAVTDGSAPPGTEENIQKLKSEIKAKEQEIAGYAKLAQESPTFRRRVISQHFRDLNSLPGLGDLFDIVPVGPEMQSLP